MARSPCARREGYKPIDVLYRRVDDDFLDPMNFNPDSMLGVPGIMDVYRAGGITIANAPGTGIADDKAIYSYMPDIVEFYTGEKAILQNVPTWRCSEATPGLRARPSRRGRGEGGARLGRLRHAGRPRRLEEGDRGLPQEAAARPGNYIAQPTLALSTVPILTQAGLAPRHVDLRPFVQVRPDGCTITPGGLTRVALKKGSLVVNSSQGRRHQGHLGVGGIGHAGQDSRRALLDVPLPRTLREHRAPDRGGVPHRADPVPTGPMTNGRASADRRRRPGLCRTHDEVEAGKVIDYLLRDMTNPSSVMAATASGAAERAAGAHGADPRGVGGRQRHLHDPEGRAERARSAPATCPRSWPRSASNRRWCAARCTARCCGTTSSISAASAPSSNAPTTPRASST
jgi:hypothetical protein